MEMYKRVASVTPVPLGDETTTAQVTTDTVILVANSGDFYEDGGHVRIDGTVYAYSAVEEGEDDDAPAPSITLVAPGLVGNVAAGTAVEVWDPKANGGAGDVVADWIVEVTDDTDGSPGIAYLTHSLIPLMSEGLPAGAGDSVTVAVDELGDWHVTDIHGVFAPRVNASLISDIDAPDESPDMIAVGLAETILLRTDPIDATTLLTFEVSTNGGADWDPFPSMPVRSTVYEVKRLPDGSPLVEGTTYQFRVTAGNDAGDATPSTAVPGILDTSAVALVAQQVIAAEVIAGFALLGTVQIGGDTFTLSPPGLDSENPAGGLRIELTNGGLIHLPADGSPATFSGDVVAQLLDVIEGMRLTGESQLAGVMELTTSDVADPTVAPTAQSYYLDVATAATSPTGFCTSADDSTLLALSGGQIIVMDDAGTTNFTVTAPPNAIGLARVGTDYYILSWVEDDQFLLYSYDDTVAPLDVLPLTLDSTTSIGRATIGTDDTNIVIAMEAEDDGWVGSTRLQRRNPTTGALVGTDIFVGSADGPLGGVYYGTSDGDFAADRWVLQPRTSDVRVYNTSGVQQSADEWPRPRDKDVRGLCPASGGRFVVIDNAGVVRTLGSSTDLPAATYWWSYAWQDSDTHTTLPSPHSSHARPKRAYIQVNAAAAPHESAAGTHVANRIAVFAGTSAVATKYLQELLSVGSRVKVPVVTVLTAGTAAPGANNWNGVVDAGIFGAATGGFSINGDSEGSVGTSTFRDSVDARVTAAMPDASTTVKGKVELATSAETITGTDTVRAVTPAADAAALAAYVPAASETAAGKAEVATQAEVTTGTDDARMVTPLKLATAVPAASETAAGKLEIATQAEVTTGTDDVRAVSPLKLATAVPAASTTAVGKVELATNAETVTGTDTVRATTPASVRAALDDFVVTGTTTNFAAIGNNRNTVGKYAGRLGFNTTTGKLIVASGATAASVWNNVGTGLVEHTPV